MKKVRTIAILSFRVNPAIGQRAMVFFSSIASTGISVTLLHSLHVGLHVRPHFFRELIPARAVAIPAVTDWVSLVVILVVAEEKHCQTDDGDIHGSHWTPPGVLLMECKPVLKSSAYDSYLHE
jgi:hypothetical protein